VVVAFGHALPFMFYSIPWRFWPIFSMTSCLNFSKWSAVSRRGGGPCSACCYFFMYAVTAHQLHTVACMRRLGANPLPWGGGPCSASCYFFMHAVAAHQLHRASASCISSFLGSFFAQCLKPLCPLSQAWLDGSCLPFLK
jgi:hypothetical protein